MAEDCLWIVLLPLGAFVIQALVGKKLPRQGDWVSVAAIAGSLVLTGPLFFRLLATGNVSDVLKVTWIALPQISTTEPAKTLDIGIVVNNLTVIMLFMVTLCSTLIHIFSVGYMHGEDRYPLFFAYLSLFSAAMLGLVISDNLFTFFMCWEVMGLCSYLLIGFYYKKTSANNASLKAFMTTRIGDVGFFIGICAIYFLFGTSNFQAIYDRVSEPAIFQASLLGFPTLTIIGLLIVMGTVGKSAQFPLQVWLPDAMEGPTPVSALIHAATMVAAGVFLLIRTYPLLQAAPNVLVVVAYLGGITAFFAALLALVQMDIKKVLAYSTISQLGYMVMGVGVGAFSAAFLHLITHACFKACLFLCSGSVIHAVHTQDMRKMGGLRTKMPWTFTCMFLSTFAIAGVPFFSGFVSKDRILAGTLSYSLTQGHWIIPCFGFASAGLTGFYMFRLIYLTFFGSARDETKHHHAQESPALMVIPLVILGILSFSFWFSGPTGFETPGGAFSTRWYDRAMLQVEEVDMHLGTPAAGNTEAIRHQAHSYALILSLLIAGLGIFLATATYLKKLVSPDSLKRMFGPIHTVLWHRYYLDDFYEKILVQRILLNWNQLLAKFDDKIIDGIFVDGWVRLALILKSIIGRFDDVIVDRLMVDGSGNIAVFGGWCLRLVQSGRVQQYLVIVFLALAVTIFLAQ